MAARSAVVYRLDDAAISLLAADKALTRLDAAAQGSITTAAQQNVGWESRDAAEAESLISKLVAGIAKPSASVRKAVAAAITLKDPDGEIVYDKLGPVADANLRDTENIPLTEDVEQYLEREVFPFAPEAWVDEEKERVGYEIPFSRLFYRYVPPRPLAEIDAEIKASQRRILALIADVAE